MVESNDLSKVKHVLIEELQDKTMGYFDVNMHEMIVQWGDVKTYNKEGMMKERDYPWNPSEHVSYFNCT